MLLIISDPDDLTVDMLLPGLRAAGVEVVFWDEHSFPAAGRVTVTFADGVPTWTVRAGGQTDDLGRVTTVWDRRRHPITVAPQVTARGQDEYSRKASRQLLDGLWATLPARWLPAPEHRCACASNKVLQLLRAVEFGFTVPDSWFTNDPESLASAWHATCGRLITKGLESPYLDRDGQSRHAYTTRVNRRHLSRRHRLAYGPAILQPDVAKALELRVTVVGSQVFAAGIDSQASPLTAQDFRHYGGSGVPYHAHELPQHVATACAKLVASFGLDFGVLDLILTPDGDHVFLELNVSGEWSGVQDRTGLPIAQAVTAWLVASEAQPAPERSLAPSTWGDRCF